MFRNGTCVYMKRGKQKCKKTVWFLRTQKRFFHGSLQHLKECYICSLHYLTHCEMLEKRCNIWYLKESAKHKENIYFRWKVFSRFFFVLMALLTTQLIFLCQDFLVSIGKSRIDFYWVTVRKIGHLIYYLWQVRG